MDFFKRYKTPTQAVVSDDKTKVSTDKTTLHETAGNSIIDDQEVIADNTGKSEADIEAASVIDERNTNRLARESQLMIKNIISEAFTWEDVKNEQERIERIISQINTDEKIMTNNPHAGMSHEEQVEKIKELLAEVKNKREKPKPTLFEFFKKIDTINYQSSSLLLEKKVEILVHWMNNLYKGEYWFEELSNNEKEDLAIKLFTEREKASEYLEKLINTNHTQEDPTTEEALSTEEVLETTELTPATTSEIEPTPEAEVTQEAPTITAEEIHDRLNAELKGIIDTVNTKHEQYIKAPEEKEGKFEKVKNFGRKVLRTFKQGDPTIQMISGTASIIMTLFGGPTSGIAQFVRPVISTLSGFMGGRGVSTLVTEKEIAKILKSANTPSNTTDFDQLDPQDQGHLFGLLTEVADRKGMKISASLATEEKAELEKIRQKATDKKIFGLDIPTKWKSFKDQFNEMPTWTRIAIPLTLSAASIAASVPAMGLAAVSMPIIVIAGLANLAITATRKGSNANYENYERSDVIENLQNSFEKLDPEKQQAFLDAARQSKEKNRKNNNIWQYGGAALGLSASVMSILHHQANQAHDMQGRQEIPPSGSGSKLGNTPQQPETSASKVPFNSTESTPGGNGNSQMGSGSAFNPDAAKPEIPNSNYNFEKPDYSPMPPTKFADIIHQGPQTGVETNYYHAPLLETNQANEIINNPNNLNTHDYQAITERIANGTAKGLRMVEDWKHPGHFQIKYLFNGQVVGHDLLEKPLGPIGHINMPPIDQQITQSIDNANQANIDSANSTNTIQPTESQLNPNQFSNYHPLNTPNNFGLDNPIGGSEHLIPSSGNPAEHISPNSNTGSEHISPSSNTNTENLALSTQTSPDVSPTNPVEQPTPITTHVATIGTDEAGKTVLNSTEHITTPTLDNSAPHQDGSSLFDHNTDGHNGTQIDHNPPETQIISETNQPNGQQIEAVVQTSGSHYQTLSENFERLVGERHFSPAEWKRFVGDLIDQINKAEKPSDMPLGMSGDFDEKSKLIVELSKKATDFASGLMTKHHIKH